MALVFSLGLLAGVGLSYGAWIWPGQQEEAPIAAASPDPSPPTELVVSETAPPTQPATEPSTQPMTEATEPETEPPTQPPTEPQEEPAAVTEPPATEPPDPEPDFAVTGYILPNSSTEYLTWEDYASPSPAGSWYWPETKFSPAMAVCFKIRTFKPISTAAAGMKAPLHRRILTPAS